MIRLTIDNLARILFMMEKIGLNISLKSKNILVQKSYRVLDKQILMLRNLVLPIN